MLTDTRERFLRSVVERMALDRIVEAFFFPPIRQGAMETGVAVIVATAVPDELAVPELAIDDSPPTDDAERAEVFTASYQWTRKGADRGKWVVQVVAQADAPLGTAATVVRGVQERAGEAIDAHRMTGDEIRAALTPPASACVPSGGHNAVVATTAIPVVAAEAPAI